jgi:subtilisin-like proprotein convertase family protein
MQRISFGAAALARLAAVTSITTFGLASGAGASALDVASTPTGPGVTAVNGTIGAWTMVDVIPAEVLAQRALSRPAKYQAVRLDLGKLRAELATAPVEGTARAAEQPQVVVLPMPDGTYARFTAVESSLLTPALAGKWSHIKMYLLQGIDDPTASGRIMTTRLGVTAAVFGIEGSVYIQRLSVANPEYHASYFVREFSNTPPRWACGTSDVAGVAPRDRPGAFRPGARDDRGGDASSKSGRTRYTYRLAMATTGEYFEASGGLEETQDNVAAVVLICNAIFEREVCSRLVLVDNNDLLLFPDPVIDPYSSPSENVGSPNYSIGPENQTVLDETIGAGNYDVGHVIHAADGIQGRAGGIGVVCLDGLKGNGFSQTTDGPADLVSPFAFNIVMHEIGHQYSGRHVFNNCDGAPGDSASVAPEPGSGSTIMSYAGICANNLQNIADPFYGQIGFDQIFGYISTGVGAPCAQLEPTGNNAPVVSVPAGATIPSKTPYELVASGSDPDNDAVTYSWETRDTGAALTIPLVPAQDNGQSPLARVFPAVVSPIRTIPQIPTLLNPTTNPSIGELLPQVSRTQKWRVSVRDNRAGAGGVAFADMNLNVIGFAGPFQVTAPNGGQTLRGVTTVTWNAANTNIPPINTQNVRITLSTDGGQTFPTELLASTPNTGSAQVVLPNRQSIQSRIRVQAEDNIYFDISDANFTVLPPLAGVTVIAAAPPTIVDRQGNNNNNGFADPGETNVGLEIPIINTGATIAVSVSASLASLTPTATISAPFALYPALAYGTVGINQSLYGVTVAPNHPCGGPINLRLTVNTTDINNVARESVINFSIIGGSGPTVLPAQNFVYVGEAVAIPDNDSVGISIPINVSGVAGTVQDLNLLLPGSGCTSAQAAQQGYPGAAISHSFVGDLIMTLTSPQGTTVTLMNRPGVGTPGRTGSSGNNFCNTVLDDDFAGPTIQTITAPAAPYAAIFPPQSPLSAFDGQNPNGTWTLSISDRAAGDTGIFRTATLQLAPNNPPQCAAPVPTGACCLPGSCSQTNATDCTSLAGTFFGNGTSCAPSPCPASTGACCVGSVCSVTTAAACTSGRFAGSGVACNVVTNFRTPCCKADFNQATGLTTQDIFDFLAAWFANSSQADINVSGSINTQDIFDYLSAWFAGCN